MWGDMGWNVEVDLASGLALGSPALLLGLGLGLGLRFWFGLGLGLGLGLGVIQ